MKAADKARAAAQADLTKTQAALKTAQDQAAKTAAELKAAHDHLLVDAVVVLRPSGHRRLEAGLRTLHLALQSTEVRRGSSTRTP